MTSFIVFYVVAGCVVGALVGCMDTVNSSFNGRAIPYPRLFAAGISAIIWPVIILKLFKVIP